jgi:hypothetical protein
MGSGTSSGPLVVRRIAVCEPLGNIKGRNRPRIGHQMLHLPSAPNSKQANFPIVVFDGSETP